MRVAGLADAKAVAVGDLPVTALGLAAFGGAGFWAAVEEELGRPVVLDCEDDAGLVMAGLRAGCRDLLFTGPAPLAAKLADMAAQVGARLRTTLPEPGTGPALDAFAAATADVRSAPVRPTGDTDDSQQEHPRCA